MLLNSASRAKRHAWIQRSDAVEQAPGQLRDDRAHGDDGVFQRADAYSILPAKLVGIRFADDAIPAYPVDQLHIKQVEVDRVRVHTVVGDLPDLRAIA